MYSHESSGSNDQASESWKGYERQLDSRQRSMILQSVDQELSQVCAGFRALGRDRDDLVEICAPWDSRLAEAVKAHGGRVQRRGLHNGYDLTKREGFLKAAAYLREHRPRYIHFSPPCFPWTPLTNLNQRSQSQIDRVHDMRQQSRKILKHCRKLYDIQVQELQAASSGTGDHHASGEQPLRAQSWGEESWKAMSSNAGGRFRVDGCAWGLDHPKSERPLQKSWGWFSTCGRLREILERKCAHKPGSHDIVQGDVSARTAIYPEELCRAFAKCIMNPRVQWDEIHKRKCRHDTTSPVFANHLAGEIGDDDIERLMNGDADARNQGQGLSNRGPQEDDDDRGQDGEGDDEHVAQAPKDARTREIYRKIRIIHANLGHPSQEVMMRTLRDAQAPADVLEVARKYECPHCRIRGRTLPKRPSAPVKVTEKWHTVSVDTFWWQSPHRVQGNPVSHGVGISFLDEATDYHAAVFIRTGSKKQGSINAQEFKNAFSKDWMRILPTPKILRLDDEGCFRDHGLIEWLESKGIQPQVIAGEGPWQNGKHSRHLEVLKENMSLLATGLDPQTNCHELLALALGAKNELHQVRGYTPNQWAFGQAKGRLESILQSGDNLAVQGSRQSGRFEDQLDVVLKARETFLQADAKRRIARAALSRARKTEVYECGDLVYFWRKGRNHALEGVWHGPGRVVCVEKTSGEGVSGTQGSIVWVVHGIVLYRCAPEQLRRVTTQTQEVDDFLSKNLSPSALLKDMQTNMNYRDVSQDVQAMPQDHEIHEEHPEEFGPGDLTEQPVARRITGKRTPGSHEHSQPVPQGRDDRPRERAQDHHLPGEGGSSSGHGADGAGEGDSGRRTTAQRDSEPGSQLHRLSREQRPIRQSPGVQSPDAGAEDRQGRGHHVSKGRTEGEEHRRQEFTEHSTRGRERLRMGGGDEHGGPLAYPRREPHHSGPAEQHAGHAAADRRPAGVRAQPAERHGDDAADPDGAPREGLPGPEADVRTEARSRSRTPMRRVSFAEDSELATCFEAVAMSDSPRTESPDFQDCGNHTCGWKHRPEEPVMSYKTGCFDWQKKASAADISWYVKEKSLEAQFASFVESGEEVFEIDLQIAPRDVHLEKRDVGSRWKVNEKAKRRAEVSFRKLQEEDKLDFLKAMQGELGSYLEREAVEIALRKDIPKERVLPMRWVLTWKAVENDQGQVTGHKPKARLIIKGFLDPDLLHLKQESPTLSTQNRNLLFAVAAQKRWKVQVGDIKTAFLNGDATERERNLGADPPEEVRRMLGMRPWELFRVLKAVYGLLHAPKVWYDKLASVLLSMGWSRSRLEPCVFKLFNDEGELIGLIGCHVDDLVCCGMGPEYESMLQQLQEAFPFGSWKDAQREGITFCGCELKQDMDGTISLNQERYAYGVSELALSSRRRQEKDSSLTQEERKQFRAVLGALSWRGTQSAPWLCASISYLQGAFGTATIEDALHLNKLVRLQNKHAEAPLVFHAGIARPLIVTFCDASWASRKDGSSQGGMFTIMADASALEGSLSVFSPLGWHSRKLPRVARSSTSAEVQMASTATDAHEFIKKILLDWFNKEPIHHDKVDDAMKQVQSVMVCDSRNLYDALSKIESSGLHLEEKRTAIEVLSIRERTQATGVTIRWVDSDQQLADGLSKNNEYEQLLEICQQGAFRLVFDPRFTSAKKKRQAAAKQRRACFEDSCK